MSPEQARGEPLDKRTDIWSFGCVLYEMLTGRRAAEGATVSDTIAAVLEHEPDWTTLPATTPPIIQHLLRRCLEKDVKRRLKDIGDARLDLEEALASPVDANAIHTAGSATSRRTWYWPLAVAALAAAIFVFGWLRSTPRVQPAALRRVSTEIGTDASLVNFQYGEGNAATLSPNGAAIAFIAKRSEGNARQIYVRRLDQLQAVPLAGTDGAVNPFFSPDGQWIAFFADGKLKKIPASGGGAVTICTAVNNRGGAWSEDGRIVFSPDRSDASLWQVPASGGKPEPLIALGDGETTQRWPQILGGGKAVLFTANSRGDGFDEANVVVQSLPNGPRKILVRGAFFGRYVRSGHLIYVHDATLFAAPFDVERLEVTGPSVPTLQGAAVNAPVGAAEIAVSDTGTVAYLPAPEDASYLAARIDWLTRDGMSTSLRATPERWLGLRFAPDGQRLAFDFFDGTQHDVRIYDWSRDTTSRPTVDPATNVNPVWTPDSRRIVFGSVRHSLLPNLYWQRADGSGEAQRLTDSERKQIPGSWHPSGTILAFTEYDTQTAAPTIKLLRLQGDEASGWRPGQPADFLKGADDAMFSPDGRWIAYVAREPGREKLQVFVQAFPGPGGRWQISSDGGENPAWSATRPELFYATTDHRIMAVPYSVSGDSFHPDKPSVIPNSHFAPRVVGRSFDVHPDGNRFALVKAADQAPVSRRHHVILIFNFFDELRRIAPPR
jgi:Tol biopolymer transport system component